ncbi:unnamed protein product, partial [Mesorhabditis belari]|uniref:Sex-determining region Y protein n=1 Tax=Mesorhabditis belari TaxID=2138241 RepID=A0AAF3JB08_9BILA
MVMAELKIDISTTPSSVSSFPTPPPSSVPEASRWTAAERREFGTDRTPSGEKIKRPMNAFMVWAQMRRAEITANSTKVHNSLISKALGVEWKTMNDDQKEPFVQKAKELRDELFKEHPNYVYRPRKRKRNPGDGPSPKHTPQPIHSPGDHTSGSEQTSPASSGKSEAELGGLPISPLLLYPSLVSLLPSLQSSPLHSFTQTLPVLSGLNSNPLLLNQLLYTQMLAAALPQR